MRRLLVLVTATSSLALGLALPVAAAPPVMEDHDCRITLTQCNPGLHKGWDPGQTVPGRRNLGG
jgi:hypothetical protein